MLKATDIRTKLSLVCSGEELDEKTDDSGKDSGSIQFL